MNTFICKQKGCKFDAESAPELCPICGNPIIMDTENDIIHDNNPLPFKQGYADASKYIENYPANKAMYNPPKEYNSKQIKEWFSGYKLAINEGIEEGKLPTPEKGFNTPT